MRRASIGAVASLPDGTTRPIASSRERPTANRLPPRRPAPDTGPPRPLSIVPPGSIVGTNVGTRWVQVEAGAGATSDDVTAVFRSLEEFPEEQVRARFDENRSRDGE